MVMFKVDFVGKLNGETQFRSFTFEIPDACSLSDVFYKARKLKSTLEIHEKMQSVKCSGLTFEDHFKGLVELPY